MLSAFFVFKVAPARERGLKLLLAALLRLPIVVAPARERGLKCRSFFQQYQLDGRSREGAWIEINSAARHAATVAVAPARERGLKYVDFYYYPSIYPSLPRGSVD